MLHKYNGVSPTIHETAFIADSADIIGNVSIGADSSVWFNATVRADSGTITIGEGTSIQDNCVVHVDPGVDEYIGNHVTVGHGAILHGATIEDNCLIGMGAVILSGAVIGHGSIVGAGSVVPPKMIIPPHSQVM